MDYTSEIPPGTRLRRAWIRGGVAYVDLTRDVERGGGSASMIARVYQIVYTATHFRSVHSVQILIEGLPREALGGEGVLIGTPLRRPPRPPEF